MKFSEKEILVGVIFLIISGGLLLNLFWVPEPEFCDDGICSSSEEKKCKLDCVWCGDGYCNSNECDTACSEDCSFSQCENRICEIEKRGKLPQYSK